MKNQIYRTVNVKYDAPPEIRPMLDDFRSMVNWLISWGLHVGRQKNPDREKYWIETRHGLRFNSYRMCEDTTEWFERTGGRSMQPTIMRQLAPSQPKLRRGLLSLDYEADEP